jgi:hypothetical protein
MLIQSLPHQGHRGEAALEANRDHRCPSRAGSEGEEKEYILPYQGGGSRVQKDTVIVEIKCEGGEVVPVFALVDGVILEKNQRLSIDLLDKSEGYIAVINPTRKNKISLNEFTEILLPHQK